MTNKTRNEICECGFTKTSHKRRDFFNTKNIKMTFADKLGLQPCKHFKPKNLNVPKNIYKESHSQGSSSREVKGSSGELNHPDTQTPQTTKNNNDDLLMNKGRPLNNNKTAGNISRISMDIPLSDKIFRMLDAQKVVFVNDVREAMQKILEMLDKTINGIKAEIEEAKKHNTREAEQSIIILSMWMLREIKQKEIIKSEMGENLI